MHRLYRKENQDGIRLTDVAGHNPYCLLILYGWFIGAAGAGATPPGSLEQLWAPAAAVSAAASQTTTVSLPSYCMCVIMQHAVCSRLPLGA